MTGEVVPEQIRMLVIDIDGTLLNPNGEITVPTRAAVQAAQQAGILVTLATARRYCNTRQIADELGLHIPLILYDGAIIVEHPQGTILHRETFPAVIAQQAVNILVRHGVQPVVHPDTGLDEQIWTGPEKFDTPSLEEYFTVNYNTLRRVPHSQLCAGHANPLRVVAFDTEETIQSVTPEIAALDCSWTTIRRGNYGSAELVAMRAGCSKASGMIALAQQFGIAPEQVMALGDNNNDIEMLQRAGWGVAMGQAPLNVKAAARAVTTSNTGDGAARAIERYVLGDGLLEARLASLSADSNALN